MSIGLSWIVMPATDSHLHDVLDRPFLFRDRPSSAPSDLRPVWRVPLVVLLVSRCRGQQATHEQLHVLNWAVRSSGSAELLGEYLTGQIPPDRPIVRMEPALDRAIALAGGLGIIVWKAKYWALSDKGRELLDNLQSDELVLVREKRLLEALPKPLTQTAVAALFQRTPR
jgi:hypothetical protein